jgi:hypothetical protein
MNNRMAPRPIQPSGRGVSSGRSGLMKSSVRSAEAELRVESMLDGHERRHQSRQHHPAQTPGEQLAHQGREDPVSVFEGRQDQDRRNPRDDHDKEHQELEQYREQSPPARIRQAAGTDHPLDDELVGAPKSGFKIDRPSVLHVSAFQSRARTQRTVREVLSLVFVG